MFLTTPSRIVPSAKLSINSALASSLVSSNTALLETTMFPRALSIFKIWNGCSTPRRGVTSLIGLISI